MNYKLLYSFNEWTTREYLTILPVYAAIFLNMIVLLASGDVGALGVSLMFSLIAGATPFFLYKYFRIKKLKEIEDQMPNFLRDLVESVKGGMSLDVAIKTATKADYGRLSNEIVKIYNQMSWGVTFDKALVTFSRRMKESDLINRTIRIIVEARKSGGDIISVMETVASDVSIIKEAEKDRKSSTSKQVMVMYMIYFMFIGIIIALTKILIPLSDLSSAGQGIGAFGGGGGPCSSTPEGNAKFICSFFLSIAKVFGMGEGSIGYYKSLFFSMTLVQGILSGLIAGQIGEDSVYAGVKHSLILMGIGFSIFVISLKAGVI